MRWKILLLLFLLHFGNIGLGQTEKGSWMIDGMLELKKAKNSSGYQIDAESQIGFFFMDNLAAGIKPSLFYRKAGYNSEVKYTNYAVAPLLRYYFFQGKFRPYFQVDYTFDWYRRPIRSFTGGMGPSTVLGYETEFHTAASTSIGANLFLNKNIALNAQFIYVLHDDRRDINRSQYNKFRGFRFGFNYFFNQNNDLRSDTLTPLVTRYLKKGNFSIGLNAFVNFRNIKQGASAGTLEWSIFLLDKLQLNNKFVSAAFWGDDTFDYFTYWGYQPDIQLFIPIVSSVFFTTTIGGDMGLFHTKVPWTTRIDAFGWSLLGKSSLVHFRKNSTLEFGTEFRYFLRDRFMVESARWDADLFLKFTQFLNANWNVQIELRRNMMGLSRREVFGGQNVDAPEFLRFGFQYFIEKN